MARRNAVLQAVAAALPTAGDDLNFASVHRGWPRSLSDAELPAAIVRRGAETIEPSLRNSRERWALRSLTVEVEVRMKHTTNLDDAMDDYVEAVEQAVLWDLELPALDGVHAVLPDGGDEIEYDDESEQPTASAVVRFLIEFEHWPADPATHGVDDPYDPDSPV